MWFTTPENSFRMSSFKTKIRRRKYALARGGAGAATPSTAAGGAAGGDKRHNRQEASGQESAAKGVPANNWEFVSFGPGLFGPRRESSASADESGDSPSNSRPNSRPPSWLAALPHHFVIEESEDDQGERPGGGGRGQQERRPDPVREAEERTSRSNNSHDLNDDSNHAHEVSHGITKTKTTPASINRSESYKERIHQRRQLRERRKTSDPNLSKTNNDAELQGQVLSFNTNSGSSSSSSLSTRSLDSPSNSLEAVSGAVGGSGATPMWDSDTEAEPDPPDWSKNVPDEVLKQLSPREKKRQEIINELFHTERTHVRGLKVLDQVFYRPIREQLVLPPDQLELLFANLEEMLIIHSQFNNLMKAKRKESPIVGDIGMLLRTMFEGEAFQKAAVSFCARQQIALDALKEKRKKEPKLHNFLTEAEMNPVCRRLQLKDIIPTGWIRLTKYPLLLENLSKHTPSECEEFTNLQWAIERSKEILSHVNKAVKEAQDEHRLAEIQRRLDRSQFDKVDHPMATEFRNIDLTKHRLIHEGCLNWRIANRPKLIDLHVLLLEDVIVLLQKQDEKYVLKFYNPTLSPVIKVSTVLVRPNAVDKKALFLVNTSQNGAQIYDLVTPSYAEKRIWFKHISDAAEAYKQRDGKHRRPEPSSIPANVDLDTSDTSVHDKTKDNDDSTEGNSSEILPPPRSNGQEDSSSPNSDSTPLPSNESTPQASPAPHTPEPASAAIKLGDGGQRRIEESLRLTTETALIEPSEVLISQRDVLTAEPVLTPLEKLRRKDEDIRRGLLEKQALVAHILHVPQEEFETIADLAGEPAVDKEATEVILAAVDQANQLSRIVNESLQISEEEAVQKLATSEVVGSNPKTLRLPSVPTHKIQGIASALNAHLTQLLSIMTERDEERERLRREVQRSREQIHALHERQNHNGPSSIQEEAVASSPLPSPLPTEPVTASEVFVDALSGEAENSLEVQE